MRRAHRCFVALAGAGLVALLGAAGCAGSGTPDGGSAVYVNDPDDFEQEECPECEGPGEATIEEEDSQ